MKEREGEKEGEGAQRKKKKKVMFTQKHLGSGAHLSTIPEGKAFCWEISQCFWENSSTEQMLSKMEPMKMLCQVRLSDAASS